jgi:hypothetical protein
MLGPLLRVFGTTEVDVEGIEVRLSFQDSQESFKRAWVDEAMLAPNA